MQQSDDVVHAASCAWHAAAAHSKPPLAAGTHGTPLQQSDDNAHEPPAATHVASALQRGTPCASTMQQLPVQPQQSLRFAEPSQVEAVDAHTLPSGSQPV